MRERYVKQLYITEKDVTKGHKKVEKRVRVINNIVVMKWINTESLSTMKR